MKVVILMYAIPQNGGVKVLFRVGNLLLERGFGVTYHVAEPRRELPFPSECEFVFSTEHYGNAIGRVAWLARTRIEADVTVATFHPTALALHLNRSTTGRKLYYVQAYEPEFYSDSMAHFARRWPMMLAAGASYLLPLEKVVNCPGSTKGLTARDRERSPEIPPGIDLQLYRPIPHKSDLPVVGHISRSEAWKGSQHFFRAMARLRESGHKFHVRIAYDLCRETCGLDYETVVPKTEAELARYYGGLDIMVSTVCQKGFGYPPLEAMASGALCLATPMDFGEPGVDHVPILANSTGSIVDAMEQALALRDRRRFIEAGLHTARQFDWNRIGDLWCEVLAGSDRS